MKMLILYNIQNCLNHFVIDNLFINNNLMDNINIDLEKEGIAYDAYQHRLRCNSYIINLAVSAFFFSKSQDAKRQVDRLIKFWFGSSVQKLNT